MYPTRLLRMQATRPLYYAAPKQSNSAHTISQRLRTLKKIPPELYPLGIVLLFAVSAGIYSSTKKLWTDKTLRLTRRNPQDRDE